MKNNSEMKASMAKDKTFEEIRYFSNFEAKVGLYNARVHSNSKIYLISYLNALIHGLLSAVNQACKEKRIEERPYLISFHLGDLLRSRCYSEEAEIISLYEALLKINQNHSDFMKIISVRNRLSFVTKDILVNILYRDKIVIEMQLGIKSDKSKFI